MTQTYVYRGKEVYLTGRTARKRGRNRDRVLHETRLIKFINMKNDPNIVSDWVEMRDLCEIDKDEQNENKL